MLKITFISADDQEFQVEASTGQTSMDVAVDNLVPGIDGDCGGVAACGTCHVYVDPEWLDVIGPAQPGIEQDMLALTDNSGPDSRLACQITLGEEHDGLVLRMPGAQH